MNDDQLLETLDACRPGSLDLESPEMAETARRLANDPGARQLFERLQRADAKIAAAMHDAPVPEGLEARLLASLAAGVVAPRAASQPAEISVESSVTGRAGWRRVARRWWPAGAGIAVAAALLAAFFLRSTEEYTRHNVLQFGLAFFASDKRDAGLLISRVSPPGNLPVSLAVVAAPNRTRWRSIEGFIGRKGVAYDISLRGGFSATLYVVPRGSLATAPKIVGSLPSSPPAQPKLTTGGLATSAWVENGLLYVLVVKGDAQDYSQFLLHSAVALALAPSSPHRTAGREVA